MVVAAIAREQRYHTSRELFERAQACLPGGNTRLTLYTHPHPIYIREGKGCRVVDVDGNSYIDFVSNMSALVHGHAHPEILGQVARVMEHGTAFGGPTRSEIDLAELLCDRLPAVEQVRFVNSGSEAVMLAIKAARAYTGKPAIAKYEGAYHGQYDYAEVSLKPTPETWGDPERPRSVPYARGVPPSVLQDVVVLPFNNTDTAVQLIRENRDRLAAVVLDVLPSRVGLLPADRKFLAAVQEECRRLRALVILDEVVSLRLDYGGGHTRYNVWPDLICMAKIVGGGFPVGAVGGSKAVMSVFDQRGGTPALPHTGTYNANPVSMTAGLASMQLLTPAAVEQINALGAELRAGLQRAIDDAGVRWQVTGDGSIFRIHPIGNPLVDYRSTRPTPEGLAQLNALYWGLADRGILVMAGGYGYLSTAMGVGEVALLVQAFRDTLADITR